MRERRGEGSFMRLVKYLFLVFSMVTCFNLSQANAVTTTCDETQPRCKFFKYLVNHIDDIACMQRIESGVNDGLCTEGSQNRATDFHDIGEFDDNLSDGKISQRYQEAVYTLAFVYQQCASDLTSDYCHKSEIFKRVLWGLDYLRRAQGPDGEISECGWMGVDFNDTDNDNQCDERYAVKEGCLVQPVYEDGTPASGFTYYAAARAISLLIKDNYEGKVNEALNDYITISAEYDSSTDKCKATKDDLRKKAYSYLITRGAYFLTHNGRGHAPNQDVWALLALYGLGDAYTQLAYEVPDEDLQKLMSDLDQGLKGDIRDEIFWDNPTAPFADDYNGFDKWFTDEGYILEWGYQPDNINVTDSHNVGYDAGYAWVALKGMAYLKFWAPNFAESDFIQKYLDWFQYFFYTNLDYQRGVFQVTATNRRNWGGGKPDIVAVGLLQEYGVTHILFNYMLEHFMKDPSDFIDLAGVQLLSEQLYGIAELIEHWTEPSLSSYVLPLNQAPLNFSTYTITEPDSRGSNVMLLQITNTNGTPDGVRYSVNDWWNGQKTYSLFDDQATVAISGTEYATCTIGGRSPEFECCKNDSCPEGNNSDDYEYVQDCTKEGNVCRDHDLTLSVKSKVPASVDPKDDVDFDNDKTGDFFDTDDDNDRMPDAWEVQYGLDPLNAGDASIDSDGDGFTNLEEYQANTSPIDPTKFPSACNIPASGDWVVSENCAIAGSSAASANVFVKAGVVLTISSQGALNLDFAGYALRVEDGGGVLIRDGGKLY